jgi:uncharacterized repeat protein (TIGR02543 family)
MAGMWIRRSSWTTIKNMWIKTSVGWSPVRGGWIRANTTSTGWKKFWTKANIPNEITKPRFNTTNNSGSGTIYDGPTATSPQFLDENLFGKDGTYTNYTGVVDRKISYGPDLVSDLNSRTTLVNDDRFTSAGGITNAMRLSVDDKYLFYEMIVENGTNYLNQITSISNGIKMIKKQPTLGSFVTSVTGNPTPGSTLTFNYNLENYYYNRVEQANSKIRWWRSSSTSPGGTIVKEEILTNTVTSSDSTSLSGTSTYQVATTADNNSYIVVEIVVGSSWTRHNGHNNEYRLNSYSAGQVKTAYRFAFGNTLYVSSNGHIGLDEGTSSNTTMSAGRNIAVYPKDLVQYYLAEYSDSSVYLLYVKSYLYDTSASSANALDYQIKFYNDPLINYCDVRIIRKGSNVSFSDFAPGYYSSGTTGFAGIIGPYVISTGTTMRIYFGGTATTTSGVSWTLIDDAYWDVIQEWTYPPGADDIFTPVVSAANQSAPIPTTPTSLSTSINASNLIVVTFSGGTGDQYDLFYANQDSRPTDQQATTDFPNVTSPYTATTLNLRGITRWFWVRKSTGTLRSNWFPAGTGITARIPLYAPPAPVITNSAQTQNSLSWHWTQPALTATQDEPTSWDYALTQSTSTPSSWTNLTTRPTSAAPLVIGSLTSGVDYYLHVRAKNDDNSTLATPVLGRTTSNKVPPTMGTPTLSAVGAFVAGQRRLSVPFTAVSGSGPAYQIYWYYSSTKPSVVSTPDGSGTSSPILDESGPTSIGRCYAYIRSAATTSTTGSVAPSTTLSDWSDGVSFDISGTRTLTYDDNTTDTTASMPTSPVSGTDPWDGWVTTVSATTPTRTGYTFNGWNTSTDGTSGTNYAASAAITLTSNVTLYAKWTANTYTITYDGNGNTSGSVPDSQTKTHGTNLTLRTNTGSLAKTGFSFGGWNTNAAGTGTSYTSGGTYSTNAGATLYARWTSTFVTPQWNGTMPTWKNTGTNGVFNTNGSNFQRTSTALRYGWDNGTFSFSGSVRGTASTDRGWDFYVSGTEPSSTTTVRTPTHTRAYSTTANTNAVHSTNFIYYVSPTYSSASRYGSIRPYVYGTDNNKYVRGTQPDGTWSASI